MATVYSKGLPSQVQQFVHGSGNNLHRDLAGPSSSSSFPTSHTATTSFRHPSAQSATADHDLGSFASGPSALSLPFRPAAGPSGATQHDARFAGGVSGGSWGLERGDQHDGAEVGALLGGPLVDAVDGDWEAELLAEQRDKHHAEATLPIDPFASAEAIAQRDSTSNGKGKAIDPSSTVPTTRGDVSPTSSALLSSLSSLDLSSRAYLRTLLSLDPATAVEDYFSRKSYADDVWGLPDEVKRLFEKARASEGGGDVEEGRQRAIRRLGMLMKHLRIDEQKDGGGAAAAGQVSLDAREGAKASATPDIARGEWARQWQEYPAAAQHIGVRRDPEQAASLNPSSLSYRPLSTQSPSSREDLQSNLSQGAATSQALAVPSSLSSSAYITVRPGDQPPLHASSHAPAPAATATSVRSPPLPASAPPSSTRAAPPASAPTDSSAPLSPFSDYLAWKLEMLTTNVGGTQGPVYNLFGGVGGGKGKGREEFQVEEGRTH
ncbi:hypothetical protein JCM5296_003017 [Sporobolomyces johnsonii]